MASVIHSSLPAALIQRLIGWGRVWAIPSFASYLLCSLVFTYPLVLQLGSHVPGAVAGDVPVYIWNLWWTKFALLAGTSPLYSDYIFAPYGVSLVFHAFVFFKALLAIPMQALFSTWTSYNLLILETFTVSAYFMYLLARHLTASRAAAWVAGLIYGFSPYMLTRGTGHLNYLSGEFIPLYALCLLRLIEEGRARWAVGGGFCLLFTAYCEYYYLIYLSIFTLAFLAYRIRRDPTSVLRPDLVKPFCLMGTIVLVGFSPILLALLAASDSGFIYGGWSGSAKMGADLLAFVVPPPGSLLYGDVGRGLYAVFTGGNAIEGTVFVGFTVLALAVWSSVRLRRDSQVRPWVWLTLMFWLLSLGPLLHIGGDFVFGIGPVRFSIPLPYFLVHYIPLIKGARVPARFDIMVNLGIAVLCAFTLRHLLQLTTKAWPATVGVFLLIVLENLRLPYPTAEVKIPEFYREIAADPRDVSVMEVPLGWRTGWGSTGRSHDWQQLYQIVHEKRIIGGFASRIPESQLQAMTELPGIAELLRLQESVPVELSPTAARRDAIRAQVLELIDHLPDFAAQRLAANAALQRFLQPVPSCAPVSDEISTGSRSSGAKLVEATQLGYIVVHPPYSTLAPLTSYLERVWSLRKLYQRNGIIAYAVVPDTSTR